MTIGTFLRHQGFPLRERYQEETPFALIRSGLVTGDETVHRVAHIEQRVLIDDRGDLVHLGLLKSSRGGARDVLLTPSTFPALFKSDLQRPVLRYLTVPVASESLLGLIDIPIGVHGWADLLIDPRGRARLLVARDRTSEDWQELADRLLRVFVDAMRAKGNRLLALVQDPEALSGYVVRKEKILDDYFTLVDVEPFTPAAL
jgi:hypothetical protein